MQRVKPCSLCCWGSVDRAGFGALTELAGILTAAACVSVRMVNSGLTFLICKMGAPISQHGSWAETKAYIQKLPAQHETHRELLSQFGFISALCFPFPPSSPVPPLPFFHCLTAGTQIQPCLPFILRPSAARAGWGGCPDPRLGALVPLPHGKAEVLLPSPVKGFTAIKPHSRPTLGMWGPARGPFIAGLFIFIHNLETSVLTFSRVADRKRTRLIFLWCWCLHASVIGKQNGSFCLSISS